MRKIILTITGYLAAVAPALRAAPVLVLVALVLPALSACQKSAVADIKSGQNVEGDPANGAKIIRTVGCNSCHIIPGIGGVEGLVGPPLDHMARRVYIAGLLRNSPDNMVRWLRDPQAIVPGNAMPNLGLSRKQAQDVTAYLYTLH